MTPDLSTISGFCPKFSGFQRTRSARQPGATWPTRWLMPCVIALARTVSDARRAQRGGTHGFTVYLAM